MAIDISAETRVARTFKDLNLNFTINPFTKDIVKRTNEDAIKNSIINLIRTKKYERPFHPEISSDVESFLFENYSPILRMTLKRSIEDVIKNFEPRANLLDVVINPDQIDNNTVDITITFAILNSTQPVTVSISMSRAR